MNEFYKKEQFKKWNPKIAMWFPFATDREAIDYHKKCKEMNESVSKMVNAKIQ